MDRDPFLKYVSLVRERVPSFSEYPFSIPAISRLDELDLRASATFFVGENGTGKSTLLEAIAMVAGLNPEGGSRNHAFDTRATHSVLKDCLRLGRGVRSSRRSDAFFLRAETFYNLATESERLGLQYGDRSLHDQSHGESFLSLVLNRFFGNGLYLLDEPEAALSPLRQMSLLVAMHDLVAAGSQFIIATHSPIIMAYPDALIYRFSETGIVAVKYTDTDHYRITRNFLTRTDQMLRQLFDDRGV
jgi:predicted ATPase